MAFFEWPLTTCFIHYKLRYGTIGEGKELVWLCRVGDYCGNDNRAATRENLSSGFPTNRD